MKILQHIRLQQLRVQIGNTVDGVAADAGQVRHANRTLPALVDDRHARHCFGIAEVVYPYLVEEPFVDFVDDLHMTWQQILEQR